MMNKINITQISTKNCGGYGAWMDNPLSSPAPKAELWRGFQLGGGIKRKLRKSLKSRKLNKSQKNKKRRHIKTRRH
jgi:hypothetical protein